MGREYRSYNSMIIGSTPANTKCAWLGRNGQFHLQLINEDDKRFVVSHHIGGFTKQGRALRPSGTLDLVCGGDHGEPEAQTDVTRTRCQFGKLRTFVIMKARSTT